jgi:hypothetical protein
MLQFNNINGQGAFLSFWKLEKSVIKLCVALSTFITTEKVLMNAADVTWYISCLIMCEIISSLTYRHSEKHLSIQYRGSAYNEACSVFLHFPINTFFLSIYTLRLWHP